jgi:hypothetical protein
VGRWLRFLLFYKPGTAFYVIGGLLLFVSVALFTQYKKEGSVDIGKMFGQDPYLEAFWQRNPRLKYVESLRNSSLVIVKDTQTGLSSMLDLGVVINAEVRPRACAGESALLARSATNLVCFQVVKPDTGAGDSYTDAVSFVMKAKDAEVAQFYRELFLSRQDKVTTIRNSSRGIVLEAENQSGNTVARIAVRSSFEMVDSFLAWNGEFEASQ